MNPEQIPFHPKFSEAIEEGRKRFTTRHDPGYDIEAGQEVLLVDGDREPLRVVRISLVGEVPAWRIPNWQFDGHREYDSTSELLEELAEYYPDADLGHASRLKVFGW